jgi:hypothetical protein
MKPTISLTRAINDAQPEFVQQVEPRSPAFVPPTIALLRSCSWAAEKLFRRHGSFRAMVWLTESMDGRRERFETQCCGPLELPDDMLLWALVAELREDFARDGVVRFALAFPADRVDLEPGPLVNPKRQRLPVVGFEGHNINGVHIGAHREILSRGRGAVLGALSPLEQLKNSRYATLLEGEADA